MATIQQEMMGGLGTMTFIKAFETIDDRQFDFLVVNANATFEVLTSSSGADLIALYNLAGASLFNGMIIRGAKGEKITHLALTAGSVIGYTNI